MGKTKDDDIALLMKKDSPGATLVAFALAAVYAAVGAVAAMAGREAIEVIIGKILAGADLEINQYSGIARASAIVGAGGMVLAWLITFLVAWHRIERAATIRQRAKVGAFWLCGAAVAYGVFSLAKLL